MTVPVALLRAQLNIDSNADDALLEHKIAAALSWLQNFVGAPLPDPLPADMTEAVLQLAAHWYEQREAVAFGVAANEIPFGVLDLVRPYREWSF